MLIFIYCMMLIEQSMMKVEGTNKEYIFVYPIIGRAGKANKKSKIVIHEMIFK